MAPGILDNKNKFCLFKYSGKVLYMGALLQVINIHNKIKNTDMKKNYVTMLLTEVFLMFRLIWR